jgi:hypothetical protein
MNLIRFPVCKRINGKYWFGGRAFKSPEAVVASQTDVEQRRGYQWQSRNAAWFGLRGILPPDAQQGGGSAA